MAILGIIELIFIGIFFVLMVVGAALDRRHVESPKWWILGLSLAVAIAYFWGKVDFTSVWTAIGDWSFWKPFFTYIAAGLIYSGLEFILSVRKMARLHNESWNRFINTTQTIFILKEGTSHHYPGQQMDGRFVTYKNGKHIIRLSNATGVDDVREVEMRKVAYREIFKRAAEADATDEDKSRAAELFRTYLDHSEYRLSDFKKDFIEIKLNEATSEVQPVINRARLSSFIGAWTFLWPAYAVSLILGDFVIEAFRFIGETFSKLGGRFVRAAFSGVFKV